MLYSISVQMPFVLCTESYSSRVIRKNVHTTFSINSHRRIIAKGDNRESECSRLPFIDTHTMISDFSHVQKT